MLAEVGSEESLGEEAKSIPEAATTMAAAVPELATGRLTVCTRSGCSPCTAQRGFDG